MSIHTIISITIAFLSALLCAELIKPLAIKVGLVDVPTARKRHQGIIPVIGGLALTYGFVIGALTLNFSLANYRALVGTISLLIIVGVLDDFHELSPKLRLLSQLLAAFFVVSWGNEQLSVMGNLFDLGDVILHAWSIPITMIAVIGLINAMNIIDGQDGLAGGIAFVQAGFLAFLAFSDHRLEDGHLLLVLMSTLLAFLLLNFPIPGRKQALIFMGDAGSTVLGLIFCWFCISLSQGITPAAPAFTFLWIMGLPIMDTLSAIVRRLLSGQSPMKPDRGHLHHQLLKFGFSVRNSSLTMIALSALFGTVGLSGQYYHIESYWMLLLFAGVWLSYLTLILYFNKKSSDANSKELSSSAKAEDPVLR